MMCIVNMCIFSYKPFDCYRVNRCDFDSSTISVVCVRCMPSQLTNVYMLLNRNVSLVLIKTTRTCVCVCVVPFGRASVRWNAFVAQRNIFTHVFVLK